MEYEVFEPDPEDEYYDQTAAYARMFNERSGNSAAIPYDDYLYFVSPVSGG